MGWIKTTEIVDSVDNAYKTHLQWNTQYPLKIFFVVWDISSVQADTCARKRVGF